MSLGKHLWPRMHSKKVRDTERGRKSRQVLHQAWFYRMLIFNCRAIGSSDNIEA
jgi:hypothetical protein